MVVSITIGLIAGTILAGVIAFLVVGGAAFVFPGVQTFLLAAGAAVLAWLTKDTVFYKSRNWQLSGGIVFASVAAMIFVSMFLGTALDAFGGSIVSYAGSVAPASVEQGGIFEGAQALLGDIDPMSAATIVSTIGATFSIVLGLDVFVFKGKLTKPKRKR